MKTCADVRMDPYKMNLVTHISSPTLDEEHVRLVLIDPGYMDPADRKAEVVFQHLTPIELKEILSGEFGMDDLGWVNPGDKEEEPLE